jgi:hypothetical protein
MFTDPFGLCADSLKDKKGLCPGGLNDKQWDRIEYAANNRMTREGRQLVLDLLYRGKIHPGLSLQARIMDKITGRPSAAFTNKITDNVHIAEESFSLRLGDFAFLLAHEGRHTAQSLFQRERDADAYGCANTWDRYVYFSGGYGNCGGR